jgi:hypothetical protein
MSAGVMLVGFGAAWLTVNNEKSYQQRVLKKGLDRGDTAPSPLKSPSHADIRSRNQQCGY